MVLWPQTLQNLAMGSALRGSAALPLPSPFPPRHPEAPFGEWVPGVGGNLTVRGLVCDLVAPLSAGGLSQAPHQICRGREHHRPAAPRGQGTGPGRVEGWRGGGVTLFPSHCLLPPETLGLGDAVLPCSTVGSLCDPGAATCPLQAVDEL